MRDALVVRPEEVVSDRDQNPVVLKGLLDGVGVENKVRHDVLPLVAPISDDALFAELQLAPLLPHVLGLLGVVIFELNDPTKAAVGGHKLEDAIHNERTAYLRLECRSFEPLEDSQLGLGKLDSILGVEEARHFANLFEVGVPECLLDDDVDQVLADCVVLVFKLRFQLHDALG